MRSGDGTLMSVSRDNLAELRARHTAGKSDSSEIRTPSLDDVQSLDHRLNEERRMRTSLKRERRLRLQEQAERLSGMKSALAKTAGMQTEGALAEIESELRSDMENELEKQINLHLSCLLYTSPSPRD